MIVLVRMHTVAFRVEAGESETPGLFGVPVAGYNGTRATGRPRMSATRCRTLRLVRRSLSLATRRPSHSIIASIRRSSGASSDCCILANLCPLVCFGYYSTRIHRGGILLQRRAGVLAVAFRIEAGESETPGSFGDSVASSYAARAVGRPSACATRCRTLRVVRRSTSLASR